MTEVFKTECIEKFDSNSEFHRLVASVNAQHGKGRVVCIVWDENMQRRGVVITQLQYGQTVRSFRVHAFYNGFTLYFLGRQKSVESGYFAGTLP